MEFCVRVVSAPRVAAAAPTSAATADCIFVNEPREMEFGVRWRIEASVARLTVGYT
jgi:hypothetical protein